MTLAVRMVPEEGGDLFLDGHTYDPRHLYPVGSAARVKVLPADGYQFAGWSGDVPRGHEDDVPLTVDITDRSQEITANFVAGIEHAAPLSVDSDFENGNGIVRYILSGRHLVVEPKQVNRSDNIWWHFKISGITPGEFLQIETVPSPIAGDCQPVYSYDGAAWHRFAGTRPPYIQKFTQSTVEVARNIPYAYTRSLELASRLRGNQVRVSNLAYSEQGRPVKLLCVTDPSAPESNRPVVWVQARQHAFESHGSWCAEGLAVWLCSDDPIAAELRRRASIYIVPILDVDNVYNGGAGKEQLSSTGERVDFNRSWGDAPHWNAVRSAKTILTTLKRERRIAAFLDLHCPWYHHDAHWFVFEEAREIAMALAQWFLEALDETDEANSWAHRFVWHSAAKREGDWAIGLTSAGQYAISTLFDDPSEGLVLLVEIPHWKDADGRPITIEGLYDYGQALGRALNKHLGGELG